MMFFLTACVHNTNVINTKSMPGNAVSKIIGKKTKVEAVKKAKNGVYIIIDDTTTNNTGVKFQTQTNTHIGPGNVKFDYEDFKTKY